MIYIKDIGKHAKRLVIALVAIEVAITILLWFYYSNYIAYRLTTGNFLEINSENDNSSPKYLIGFIIPSNDPILERELRPNFSQLFDGSIVKFPKVVNVTINSNGFRGKEYSIEKPNNTIRVLVLGDSVAFGWGVNENETFSVVLEKMLNSDAQKKYEVLNLAVPGYNTEQEVEMLKTKGLKYNPDIIIIAYHRNDVTNSTEERELADAYYRKIFANATEAYKEIPKDFSLLREKYLHTLSQNLDMSDYDRHTFGTWWATNLIDNRLLETFDEINWDRIYVPWENLYNLTKGRDLKVIIVTGIEIFQDNYHLKVMGEFIPFFKQKVLPDKTDWYLFDFQSTVMKYPREELVIDPVDGHPNPFCYELMAKEIYNFMKDNSMVK